jgi:hypothetical protein
MFIKRRCVLEDQELSDLTEAKAEAVAKLALLKGRGKCWCWCGE